MEPGRDKVAFTRKPLASPAPPGEVTELLLAWSQGDGRALDRLVPLVYDELRRLARHHMRCERPGHALQTTALVHEAYLRLVNQRSVRWQNRAQFFGVAAQLMRRILVDHARALHSAKRGSGVPTLPLSEEATLSPERAEEIVVVDEALRRLKEIEPRKSRVVELRFFGGLSVEEAAEVLGTSPVTVARDWRAARAWLYHEIRKD